MQTRSKEKLNPKMENTETQSFEPMSLDRLLLMCTGQGAIVFAHGDAGILDLKLDDLKDKSFFSLGFTQLSLKKLKKQAQGGLLQPPRHRKHFQLQRVRPHCPKVTMWAFLDHSSQFLSKLHVSCSLVRVEMSTQLIQAGLCKVVKQSLTLLDTQRDEHFLTLLEICLPAKSNLYRFATSYEDFCYTRGQMNQGRMSQVKLEDGIDYEE